MAHEALDPPSPIDKLIGTTESLEAMARSDPGQFSGFEVTVTDAEVSFTTGSHTSYNQVVIRRDQDGTLCLVRVGQRPATEVDGATGGHTRKTDIYPLETGKPTLHTHEIGRLIGRELEPDKLDSAQGTLNDNLIETILTEINYLMARPQENSGLMRRIGSALFGGR